MRWFFSPAYDYGSGLPGDPREVHGFALHKPSEIRDALIACGAAAAAVFEAPAPVSMEDLALVHDAAVIDGLRNPRAVAAAIELPEAALLPAEMVWQAVVAPQLLAAGGTRDALRAAAAGKWAINLSGGFHHARRNLSHGFCLINDVALGVAALRRDGARPRILIIDLDLHQGDGNAAIFAGDPDVYTASVHEGNIFPVPKARSDLDLELPAFAGDAEYLRAVERLLARTRAECHPQIAVYLAGSDPYEGDPLGSLQVTRAALLARDRAVAGFARDLGCALVALPAGGYSPESPSITAAGFAAIAACDPGRA